MKAFMRPHISRFQVLGFCLGAVLVSSASGCLAPKLVPISLKDEGWTSREFPAVWQQSSRAPEIAGDVLVAFHTDGTRYIQFSKGGLPILSARASKDGWMLSSSLRKGTFGGHSSPPNSIVWFQVPTVSHPGPSAIKPPWVLETAENGGWILRHLRSGERLEGLGEP
jgi:hypothetical protein